MSTERIDVLRRWQELAAAEREALVALRDSLADVDEAYPRLRSLDGVIKDIDTSITQREVSIASVVRAQERPVDATELQRLLRSQEESQDERAALIAARNQILDDADMAGSTDLTTEQDRRFRALTREIADVDAEIDSRAQQIEVLAALSGN